MKVFSHSFVFGGSGIRAAVLAALVCLVFAAVSCRTIEKTVTVEVPVNVHDTSYVAQHVHDSVYIENTEYIKGDTVYRDRTKYVEKLKTDTLVKYVEKPVEIYNEVVTTKYVEKELRWWQKTLMFFGSLFFLGIVVYIVMFLLSIKKT